MKKPAFASLFFLLIVFFSTAQKFPLGIFEAQGEIGKVARPGALQYDASDQTYLLSGAGTNMWFGQDQCHFVWKKLSGDFIVQTRASFPEKGVEPHRKMGWMVRASLDSSSPNVNAAVHGDGLTSLQFRKTAGANTEEIKSPLSGAGIIQLERKGNSYIMSVAREGELFTRTMISDIDMGTEVWVGLFVCSHNPAVIEKAKFSNVLITQPAPADLVPYKSYIGSLLQILDPFSGKSEVVFQSTTSLQAPNWLKDGKSLLYNRDGLLYRFDLQTKTPVRLNTGMAIHNNNDHVISFDGKSLGISNHSSQDSNVSIIYTLPLAGGEPQRVTDRGPSYLHGWSPDGKFLVFTGQRNQEFDIYKIPVKGGKETRLTDAPGLDDGSEYSPDGKFIYFNSSRTGLMQLWRMKPDGSDQQRLTLDSLNDWFPHVSPDGKWIAFLSFGPEISATDHPFYKQVYLRLMPAGGGPARVIAYLYGGQGTINTPSWSPDGRHLAFISNSKLLFPNFPLEQP